MHAVNVVKKCARCDMLASLLYTTDLLFLLQNSFVISPTSESTQKDKEAIVKASFYWNLSGVESNAQIKRVQVTFFLEFTSFVCLQGRIRLAQR